ncbi:hypothetical protein [Enterococcus italicus]|uniref:hypothetical protein n=1 Tax=Enterococcus italicus TaxID=246144 RepID=UPI003F471E57
MHLRQSRAYSGLPMYDYGYGWEITLSIEEILTIFISTSFCWQVYGIVEDIGGLAHFAEMLDDSFHEE